MHQSSAILALQFDSQVAIPQLIRRLEQCGLHAMCSFDLSVARATQVDCTCPYHGTEHCDCQMVVLLVYGQDGPPVTLVVHGHDGKTNIALVDIPEQRPTTQLVDTIQQAILPMGEPDKKVDRGI